MIRELKENYSYTRVITFLSVFTFIFGAAVCFVGGIFIPVASAFLAALFLFENPKKRIFSFVCPLASILLSTLAIGPITLIGIEYVLLALIIIVCYKKSLSKAETAVYLTALISIFVILSLYINAAIIIDDFSFTAVKDYFVLGYAEFHDGLLTFLSELTITTQEGITENAMTVEDAKTFLTTLTNSFVSVTVITAFVLAGLTEKLYSTLVLHYAKHGILKSFAHFIPSTISSIAYIITAVLSIFVSESTRFGIILSNVNSILLVIFLYMGLKYLFMVAKASPKRILIYALIIMGLISFSNIAPKIISYLGVWVVIGTNSYNKHSAE